MASAGVVIGAIFIIGLFIFGVVQTQLPRSSFAGAVTDDSKSQQRINLCMQDCMRACVTQPGTEERCRKSCDLTCGIDG